MFPLHMNIFLKAVITSTGLVFLVPAYAHYLWLESVEGLPRIYFGEYQEGLHEKTGDRLDTIAEPQVQALLAGKNPLKVKVERKEDHLAIIKAPAHAQLIAQEVSMKVKDLSKNKIGIVKPMYYARLANGDMGEATSLALDIQPVAPGQVRVNFQGKPLAKATVVLYAPNQWMREYKTDDKGEALIETPWPGLYVAEVVHLEPSPGTYQGDVYEMVRHVSTLTLVRP